MRRIVPVLALVPAMIILGVFFCGSIAWTIALSFTSTRLMPRADFVGLANYRQLLEDPRFGASFLHLAEFGVAFVGATLLLGLVLAVAVDSAGERSKPVLKMVFLYPFAVSWLLTDLVWQWILNPGLGLERTVRDWGWTSFRADALVQPRTALLMVAVAGVWHAAGFVMVLFLAGLGSVPSDIRKTLQVEAVPAWRGYLHVLVPMVRPHAAVAALLLCFVVAQTFDLVVALTGGGLVSRRTCQRC